MTLAEHSPAGSPVITVTATDKDTGENGKISYRVMSSTRDIFYIDPNNGRLTSCIMAVSQCQECFLNRTPPCELGAKKARLRTFLAFEINVFRCCAAAFLKYANLSMYAKDCGYFLNFKDTPMHLVEFWRISDFGAMLDGIR